MNIKSIAKKALSTVAMSALALGIATAGASAGAAPAQAAKPVNDYTIADRCGASWDTKTAEQILGQLNSYRKSKGAKPLKLDYLNLDWASFWTTSMARDDYFEHNPSNNAFGNAYPEVGMWGENIAWRTSNNASASSFMKGWKKSPGHNKNMLNKKWKGVGIALHKSSKTGRVYATQFFTENASYPIPNQKKTQDCKNYFGKKAYDKAKKDYKSAQSAYKKADKAADSTIKKLSKQRGKSGKTYAAYKSLKKAESSAKKYNKSISKLKSKKTLDKQTKLLKSKTKDLKSKTSKAKKYIKKR